MVEFGQLFTNITLVGLLVLGSILFVVQLQTDNSVTDNILNDSIINSTFSNLNSSFDTYSSEGESNKEGFEADIPERGFGSLIVFAIVGTAQKFTSMVVGVYNILIVLPASKLGIPAAVINVIGALFSVAIVLSAWRLYRAGA